MTEQVRIGMIGTSWWTETALLPMFAGNPRATIAAVCGRNPVRTAELAQKFDISQTFSDYRHMIAQGKLNAVIIATPDDMHYEMVMAALDAGLHVLCEKPIALNSRDAKAMAEKADAANLRHMVMYTWHWLPTIQRFKRLVDEGCIGRIYHADFQWQADFWRSGNYQWRADADRANGILGDLGSHLLHLALWTMGEVEAVYARLGTHLPVQGVDGKRVNAANDTALLTLAFASGAQAQVAISAVASTIDPMKPSCTLYGEKGTLESGWMFNRNMTQITPYLRGRFDDGRENINEASSFDLSFYFAAHPAGRQFVDAILEDKPIYPGLYEGYKVQQLINAALESHQTGCRVVITS